jgi:hypothetical protein
LAASWILLAEFAGDEAECRQDAEWFESELGGTRPEVFRGEDALASIDAVREALAAGLHTAGIRVRIATLPRKLEACVRPLVKTGARMMVDPGLGLVYAEIAAEIAAEAPAEAAEDDAGTGSSGNAASLDLARVFEFIRIARAAAAACAGSLLFESLPSPAKREFDVFGEALGPALAVMRRLKQEFDPQGLLNPHRFVGGI